MIRTSVCVKVLPIAFCTLWVVSNPNAIEDYVFKKGRNTTGGKKSV